MGRAVITPTVLPQPILAFDRHRQTTRTRKSLYDFLDQAILVFRTVGSNPDAGEIADAQEDMFLERAAATASEASKRRVGESDWPAFFRRSLWSSTRFRRFCGGLNVHM
jgi:hypothetical protein